MHVLSKKNLSGPISNSFYTKGHQVLQNELLTYLWYLNLGYTLRDLQVIQKFNNDDNDD